MSDSRRIIAIVRETLTGFHVVVWVRWLDAQHVLTSVEFDSLTGSERFLRQCVGAGEQVAFVDDLGKQHARHSLHRKDFLHATGELQESDHWLIPTAEVPVTNIFRDETIDVAETISFCAYTPCFRSEAGRMARMCGG